MPGPTPQRTVLVVEDDAAIRELLRLHLDLAGFAIEERDASRERASGTGYRATRPARWSRAAVAPT